ncbi:MAG: hypothetical protein M1537_01745 [Nitrospirae bacterium]|nr:hypothetical protein [Nitrospirota bacterium]
MKSFLRADASAMAIPRMLERDLRSLHPEVFPSILPDPEQKRQKNTLFHRQGV